MKFNLRKTFLLASCCLALSYGEVLAAADSVSNIYIQGFGGVTSNNFSSILTDAEKLRMDVQKGKFSYGAAIGYQINSRWRVDLNYTGHAKNKIILSDAELQKFDPPTTATMDEIKQALIDKDAAKALTGGGKVDLIMVNGYFDFADVNYGLAPYATIGLGIAQISKVEDFGTLNTTTVKKILINFPHSKVKAVNRLAYQFGGGILYKFNNDFIIDAGIRYTSAATKKITGFNEKDYSNIAIQIGVRFHF